MTDARQCPEHSGSIRCVMEDGHAPPSPFEHNFGGIGPFTPGARRYRDAEGVLHWSFGEPQCGAEIVGFSFGHDGLFRFEILCDCATVTTIVMGPSPAIREFAYTCDGCLSVHWVTLEPTP